MAWVDDLAVELKWRDGRRRVARHAGSHRPGAKAAVSATDVTSLSTDLTVQRTDRGGLVIEAPPETASTLAALFARMAQLFQAAAPGVEPVGTAGLPKDGPIPRRRPRR